LAHVQTKNQSARRQINWTRVVLIALGTIVVWGLLGWDEVALGAPSIFLVETLGFGVGLGVFIVIWMTLGYAMLLFNDLVWPSLKPIWESIVKWAMEQWKRYSLYISIAVAISLTAAAYIGFRCYLLYTAIALAAVVFVGVMETARQFFQDRVREIDPRKGRRIRWVGAIAAMVILGPVLAWTLLQWLQFSRRAVYVLTIPAAVIFGIIWVPFYSGIVWNNILERIA